MTGYLKPLFTYSHWSLFDLKCQRTSDIKYGVYTERITPPGGCVTLLWALDSKFPRDHPGNHWGLTTMCVPKHAEEPLCAG